jgi:hypothetical protein
MRQLRDARSQAEALEHYLATLAPAYRQAADGRAAGASYREIGVALFGERRVLGEPWKTSPLRAAVIALARNASALIGGGYLALLRHRRKQ